MTPGSDHISTSDNEAEIVPSGRLRDRPRSQEDLAIECDDLLILIVGSDNQPTGVRKLIVSRAHVEWLSLWWKSRPQNPTRFDRIKDVTIKEVWLLNEDAESIYWIMLVAHLQAYRLPEMIDLLELLKLADLVYRTGCSRTMAPHIGKWLAFYRPHAQKPGYEELLNIAYYFGDEKLYLEMASHFVLTCKTDHHGELLTSDGHELEWLFPDCIYTIIKHRRLRLIARLLATAYAQIHEMGLENHCQLPGADSTVQTQCTAYMKLRFERHLAEYSLLPRVRHASIARGSANDLLSILRYEVEDAEARERIIHVDSYGEQFDRDHELYSVHDQMVNKTARCQIGRPLPVDMGLLAQIRRNGEHFPWHSSRPVDYQPDYIPDVDPNEDCGVVYRESDGIPSNPTPILQYLT